MLESDLSGRIQWVEQEERILYTSLSLQYIVHSFFSFESVGCKKL